MAVCNFNYKYVKDNSTPGSFRRGYEAYKTNGDNYIYDVCQTYYNGKINIYEVSNYLNVKVEGIPRLGIMLKEVSR